MKNSLSYRTISILITVILIGCAGPSKRLEKRLETYKEAYQLKDYMTLASMSMPSVVEMVGGTENFTKVMNMATHTMEQLGFVPELKEFHKPGPIVSANGIYVSVIPTSVPAIMHGKTGVAKGSIIAFSEDKGVNWFFVPGSHAGIKLLSKVAPDIVTKISIPTPTLIFGSGDDKEALIQRNGKWIKQ